MVNTGLLKPFRVFAIMLPFIFSIGLYKALDRVQINQNRVYSWQSQSYTQQIEWLWACTKLSYRYSNFLHAASDFMAGKPGVDRYTVLDEFDIFWSWFSSLDVFQTLVFDEEYVPDGINPDLLDWQLRIRELAKNLGQTGEQVLENAEPLVLALESGNTDELQALIQNFTSVMPTVTNLQNEVMLLMRGTMQTQAKLNSEQNRNLNIAYKSITFIVLLISAGIGIYFWRQNKSHGLLERKNDELHTLYEEQSRHAEELDKVAYTDTLTGLSNRAGFFREMDQLFAKPGRHGICFIGLDRFKVVNDSVGQMGGDELLRQISGEITGRCQRAEVPCFIARYGGDEFVLVLKDCSSEAFEEASHEILEALCQYEFRYEGRVLEVAVSMGAYHFDATQASSETVVAYVEAACQEAKSLGGSRLRIYNSENNLMESRRSDVDVIERIQQALWLERFELYFQPIVELTETAWVPRSIELLIRMNGEDGQVVSPGEFLPVAERYGLMPRIDKWVVQNALCWLEKNSLSELDMKYININLSGLSISDEEFVSDLITMIEDHDINTEEVCFEVTESVAIQGSALQNLERLNALGVYLSLDDFGSGFSSFGYLEKIPVSQIKIDGAFVKDLDSNFAHQEFVRAIATLGHAMGKYTVGEFVENEASRKMLYELGINAAQGYYIAKPRPLSELYPSTDINDIARAA